jgi:hypothetical protein
MRIFSCLRSCFGGLRGSEVPASRSKAAASLVPIANNAIGESSRLTPSALPADRISSPPSSEVPKLFLDELLIEKFPTISDANFLRAVDAAKASCDLQPLKEVFSRKGASVSPRAFSVALSQFASDKNLEALQLLLANGRQDVLTYSSFVLLAKKAIDNSFSDESQMQNIIHLLISARSGFPQNLIEELICYASKKGSKVALETLLEGHTISPQGLNDALGEALLNFRDSSVIELLLKDRISLIDDAVLHNFFSLASEHGLYDLADLICKSKDGDHSNEARFLAAKVFLARGDESGFRRIIEGVTFSQDQQNMFLTDAIHYNLPEIVREILPSINYAELNWFDTFNLIEFIQSQGWHEILREVLPQAINLNEDDANSLIASTTDVRIRAFFLEAGYLIKSGGVLELSLEDLKENPLKWLKYLDENGMPDMIRFSESSIAIDAGGLSKQFITFLVEAVVNKGLINISDTGMVICRTDDQKAILRQIGRLYSMIDAKNNHAAERVLTGCLLHSRFLEFVKIAASKSSDDEKLIATATLLKDIFPTRSNDVNLIIEPSEENKRAWMEAIFVDEISDEDIQELKQEFQTYLDAASAFYSGTSRNLRAKLAKDSPKEILEAIQGKAISSDNIIRSLKIEGSDPQLLEKLEWIKEKIRSSDDEFLTKFVFAVTGKKSISPTDCIIVKNNLITREAETFRIHTCFNTIDLPQATMSKEDFLLGLEGCLDEYFQDA